MRIAAARLCGALRMSDSLPWVADLLATQGRRFGRRRCGPSTWAAAGLVDALMSAVGRIPQHRLAIELAHAASDMDIEALMREPASVQAAVVTVLGVCGLRRDPLRADSLNAIAHDRRWPARVRVAACRSSAMIGDPEMAAGLVNLAGDPDAAVRSAAAKAHRRLSLAGGRPRMKLSERLTAHQQTPLATPVMPVAPSPNGPAAPGAAAPPATPPRPAAPMPVMPPVPAALVSESSVKLTPTLAAAKAEVHAKLLAHHTAQIDINNPAAIRSNTYASEAGRTSAPPKKKKKNVLLI